MKTQLTSQRCVPCQGGEPPLADGEVAKFLQQVSGWSVSSVDGHPSLGKTFHFANFVESVDFVLRIRDVAEAEGHHPDLAIHWNTVRVENWTHAIGGLHENDFILAAKIDQAASDGSGLA